MIIFGDQMKKAAGWLGNYVLSRYKNLKGLPATRDKLVEELDYIDSLLKKESSNNKSEWFKKATKVFLDAESLLDDWSYDALKNDGAFVEKSGLLKELELVKTTVSNLLEEDETTKVNKLLALIEEVKKEAKDSEDSHTLARKNKDSDGMTEEERAKLIMLRGYEHVDSRLLLGREEDIKKLRKMIRDCISSSRRLSVIGIIGFAGVGKTALSKEIAKKEMRDEPIDNDSSKNETPEYSSSKKAFDHVFEVSVSHRYCLLEILKKMAKDLSIDTSIVKESSDLKNKLKDKLKGKRFLLILDDVWNTLEWKHLELTLHDITGVNESKDESNDESKVVILMTGRPPAKGKDGVYNGMTSLEKEKFENACKVYNLEALQDYYSWSLFEAMLADKRNELEAADSEIKKMVEHMVTLCRGVPLAIRVLANLLSVEDIDNWKAIGDSAIWKTSDDILSSLRLSYTYLPTELLKICFSFCSIFKEGEVINKDKLIYMWTAQGFLWEKEDGESYDAMELKGEDIVKCLLNRSFFLEPKLDKFGNIISFKMHDLFHALAKDVSEGQRWESWKKKMSNIEGEWSSDDPKKQLENFKRIRYLELRVDCLKPIVLPGHITELYHLQTLWINSSFNLETKKRSYVRFPVDNLKKLRHIRHDSSSIGIPEGLGRLTALCTLPTVNLAFDWGGSPEEIGCLENLRGKLEFRKVTCLKSVEEASSLKLEKKSKLDNLVLHWTELGSVVENPNADDILKALEPNKELKKLEIRLYDGTKFPSWLTILPKLVSLEIHFGKAEGKVELGNFNVLRFLTLNHCPKLTITFPSKGVGCCVVLEEVKIEHCKKVETSECDSQNISMSQFEKLRSLHIWDNVEENKVLLTELSTVPHLSYLCIDVELVNLDDLNERSRVCSSLETLKLKNSGSTATLPHQLKHLKALRFINLVGFKSLKELPDWLRKLTSLRLLQLESWPILNQLPSSDVMRSLSNLHTLNIEDCPLSEEDIKCWLKSNSRRRVTLDDIPVVLGSELMD